MPWHEVSRMSLKLEFVKLVLEGKSPFSELCARFNISRPTGYQLLKRYKESGLSGLEGLSRRPHSSPSKTGQEIEEKVVELRQKKPCWGGRKLRAWLLNQGEREVPSASTITDILRRHGLINVEESKKHQPFIRFEHGAPNDLWQMDFKGHFAMANGRCHPLTILDDHSRFSIGLQACQNQTGLTVKTHLIRLFQRYGLPSRMNMDNGVPWNAIKNGRNFTELSFWLIRLGIRLSFSSFGHPQTNGKDERFHRTLKRELLQFHYFKHLEEAQEKFDEWREEYNLERPHEALNMKPPVTRYQVSQRMYSEKLPAIEYRNTDIVRKVDKAGKISYKNMDYFISEGLRGEYIALREKEDKTLEVFYLNQKVSKIDLEKKK